MAKFDEIRKMFRQSMFEVTKTTNDWQSFLRFLGRNFGLRFDEQVLAYEQNPNATALMTMNNWNRYNRWVAKGSKSIVVFDKENGANNKLKYYFDISQTEEGRIGDVVKPPLWKVETKEEKDIVSLALTNLSGIKTEENYSYEDIIIHAVEKVTKDNIKPYEKYEKIVKESATYAVLSRLGADYENYASYSDFSKISELDENEILHIGNSVRNICKLTIAEARNSILEQYKERDRENDKDIQQGRARREKTQDPEVIRAGRSEGRRNVELGYGLDDRQHDTRRGRDERGRENETISDESRRRGILQGLGNGAGENAKVFNRDRERQDSSLHFGRYEQDVYTEQRDEASSESKRELVGAIGKSETQLYGGLSEGNAERDEGRRNFDGVSSERRISSEEYGEEADRGYENKGRSDGRNEKQRSTRLGAEDEQHHFESERNRSRQSVESLAGTQLKFDLEAEELTPAFFITENTIDKFLLQGSNTSNARKIIVSEFSKSKSDEELIEVLKKVYHGGYGMFTEEGEISAWYAEDGIHLAKGKNAKGKNAQVVSWKDVVIRINGLLENGEFATNIEIVEASSFERSRLSESLIYLTQDISVEGKEQNLLGRIAEIKKGSFVNIVDELAEKLSDSYFVNNLLKEYEDFKIAYTSDRNILRFHFHDVEGIYQRLQELKLPRRKYDTTLNEIPKVASFITEDEIFETLSRGSSFSKGKERITNFFSENQDLQDRAEFLKKEYGTGGRNYAISNTPSSNEDYDSKGIKLRKSNCKEVFLTWPKVSKYIDELISKNLYIVENEKNTEAELDETVLEDDAAIVEIDTKEQEEPAKIENSLKLKISFSENPLVHELLGDKLPAEIDFALGNRILSDIDRINNELMKGYDKTDFVIEAAINGEEFRYEGRYDLGDGEIDLIEHIRNGINAWQENFGEDLSLDGKERAEYMLNTALPFLEERRDLDEIQQRYYEGSIRNTIEKYQRYLEVKNLLEEDESNEASSKFIIKYDGNNYLFDYSYIGRTIEDGAVLAIQLVSESDPSNVITITYEENEEVKRQIDERVGLFRNSEVETLNPEIQNSGQSFNLNAKKDFNLKDNPLEIAGKKERFRRNMKAINTLKEIEFEDRLATPEEQLILSRYVGWGGLSEAFDENNAAWKNEFNELYTALSPSEYASARESTLSAFYTPTEVINAIYKGIDDMGYTNGNILEPSCGTGNFIGMLPDSMKGSKVYGVELDPISASISKQLYQTADIKCCGFENYDVSDNFFDVAVGNVPFGDFKVNDRRYNKHNFLIHDYFFAKTIDKVRSGGIIALITSKGTLDKENSSVRKYIAERADLLGAIRLPNDTFKGNAGTEAVSDILFLQKKEDVTKDIEPSWVNVSTNEDGMRVNSYFIEHPEMVLGKLEMVSGPYGERLTCTPHDDKILEEQLNTAISNIKGNITDVKLDLDKKLDETEIVTLPAEPNLKNFSFIEVDGDIYFKEGSLMYKQDIKKDSDKERIIGLINIRDLTRELIELQKNDVNEEEILSLRDKLNRVYDTFVSQYGNISNKVNTRLFEKDSSIYLISSLEKIEEKNGKEHISKTDIFFKRTIKPHKVATRVETAAEALAISLSEKARVDIEYMKSLSQKDEEQLIKELSGAVYLNPEWLHTEDENLSEEGREILKTQITKYLPADEYLSGNVRKKLEVAKELAESDKRYECNVKALEDIQPKYIPASEISANLGATWIPEKDIEAFIFELLETPAYLRMSRYYSGIGVHFSQYSGEWNIEGKSKDRGNIKAETTYGTSRINAYRIIEDTLNLKDVRIYDYDVDENGKKIAILNKKETTLAQAKQAEIKEAFKDWIWKDISRRDRLEKLYNEKFNSIRPREYDGSHLSFAEMNPEIELKEHQRDAVARILYGGNTLLAHVVGAGKTFEMASAAMESKRLGLCNKPMFVVPNHLTEQWGAEFLKLYPAANILVTTKKDFEKNNRKKFCTRIATGDYDAVIIGHSQFEKIPMSKERQELMLNRQLDEITEGITELRNNRGDNFSIKQLEKSRKQIKIKLEKLNDQSKKDDVITFEELGVDKLFVDESHYYKNLYLYTKMRNVGGIAQTEAQKSSDLFMKCRYLDEMTGNKGTVFATGTPISNSMVEMYTLQRYLQYDMLCENNLQHFDAWASTFGETVTSIELNPEGTGFRAKTNFAKFNNCPELKTMFSECADIKTADELDLDVPIANKHTVVTKASEYQKAMVKGFGERAENIRNGQVDPSVDNMLKITSDAKKLSLDQRLLNDEMDDFEGSKINTCVNNVYDIWKDNKDTLATQLVFLDMSIPKDNGEYSAYNDIKEKLIEKGVPSKEIAFIHDAKNDKQKDELFRKVREGKIRVLLGSTQKMGAGTNVQERLKAVHHLDCPWRPSDLEQREGRIIRQGNTNKEVDVFTYVTEGTFDAYLFQIIEKKQRFISQIMTSKTPLRSMEDCDEVVLKYEEIKVLSTGNPLIKDKMELDREVANLKLQKQSYLSNKYSLENKVKYRIPEKIERYKNIIEGLKTNIEIAKNNPKSENAESFVGLAVNGIVYQDKKEAGEMILKTCKRTFGTLPKTFGEYRGFKLEIQFNPVNGKHSMWIVGGINKEVELGSDVFGNFTRLDNAIDSYEKQLKDTELKLDEAIHQLEIAKKELEKPFAKEEELSEKNKKLAEINARLNLDDKDKENIALVQGKYEEFGIKLNNKNEVVCLVDDTETIWINDTGNLVERIDFSFMENSPTAKEMMQLLSDIASHYNLDLDCTKYADLIQFIDLDDFSRLDGAYEYISLLNAQRKETEKPEENLKDIIISKFIKAEEQLGCSKHNSAALDLEI